MTRKEQIMMESIVRFPRIDQNSARYYFSEGAKWADANRWISVEDRLPGISNDMSDVVITLKPGQIDLDHYHKDGYWMMDYEDELTTHWMPIPEPPKSDK